MAELKDKVRSYGSEQVLFSVAFAGAGALAPTAVYDSIENKSQTTVAAPSPAGVYEVTIPRLGGGWPQEMLSCVGVVTDTAANMAAALTAFRLAYVKDSYVPSTGKFKVAAILGTTLTNLPVGAEAMVSVFMRRQKLGKQR
jgi:hypothetical protein